MSAGRGLGEVKQMRAEGGRGVAKGQGFFVLEVQMSEECPM